MVRSKINVLLIVLGTLLSTSVFAGGPWTQAKGKGYYKLSEWWVVFDQHYTDNGEIDPNVTTGIFNTYLYAEYGLNDKLTTIFNGAIFSRNYMNSIVSGSTGKTLVEGEAINAMGDIDVGAKYRITKDDAAVPVAVSLFLGLPTGVQGKGKEGNLQTGDGEFNQMVQVDLGKGFSITENIAGYVAGYTGFNVRSKGFSEEFRYGLEGGVGLFNSRLWLIGRLFGVESLKNGLTAESVSSTSIFANNTEYFSFSYEVVGYLSKKFGISAAYAGAFRAEIIAAAPSYSLGVFLDLSK